MRRMIGAGALCATAFLGWSQLLEAAIPSGTSSITEIESTSYYLPVYNSGAVYAGESEDRDTDARDNLEAWKMEERNEIEKTGSENRRVGERNLNDRLAVIQKDLTLTDEEFASFLEESNAETT